MSKDEGRFAVGDRATHERSQQAVSAVPVGIPSACNRACAMRQRLDRRIHAQRLANRETWETVDVRQAGQRRFTLGVMRQANELLDALGIPRRSRDGIGWRSMDWRLREAIAQAIEARRAETGTGSVEDESAVPQGCAPTTPEGANP